MINDEKSKEDLIAELVELNNANTCLQNSIINKIAAFIIAKELRKEKLNLLNSLDEATKKLDLAIHIIVQETAVNH